MHSVKDTFDLSEKTLEVTASSMQGGPWEFCADDEEWLCHQWSASRSPFFNFLYFNRKMKDSKAAIRHKHVFYMVTTSCYRKVCIICRAGKEIFEMSNRMFQAHGELSKECWNTGCGQASSKSVVEMKGRSGESKTPSTSQTWSSFMLHWQYLRLNLL